MAYDHTPVSCLKPSVSLPSFVHSAPEPLVPDAWSLQVKPAVPTAEGSTGVCHSTTHKKKEHSTAQHGAGWWVAVGLGLRAPRCPPMPLLAGLQHLSSPTPDVAQAHA